MVMGMMVGMMMVMAIIGLVMMMTLMGMRKVMAMILVMIVGVMGGAEGHGCVHKRLFDKNIVGVPASGAGAGVAGVAAGDDEPTSHHQKMTLVPWAMS